MRRRQAGYTFIEIAIVAAIVAGVSTGAPMANHGWHTGSSRQTKSSARQYANNTRGS